MTSPFQDISKDRLLFESKYTKAFYDAYPVSEGHALVVPKRAVAGLFELSETAYHDVWIAVKEVRNMLHQAYHPDGFNIGINDGAAAGQTIVHTHIHIIPRYTGDSSDPRGGIRQIFPDKARYWA